MEYDAYAQKKLDEDAENDRVAHNGLPTDRPCARSWGNSIQRLSISDSGSIPIGMNISQVDSFDYTTAGSGQELRPGNGADPWCYAGQGCDAFYNVADSYGACMGVGVGAWGAIKIRLAESGIYRPEMPYLSGDQCGIVRMYIAPENADDPMADTWSVGIVDTYAGTSEHLRAGFRARELEAGDYIVSWEIVGNDPKIQAAARLWFGGVELIALEAYPEMTVSAGELAPIRQGAVATVRLSAEVNDGTAEDLRSAVYMVGPEWEDTISLRGVTDEAGNPCLEITALKVCDDDITVQVQMNGAVRASFVLPVQIVQGSALDRVTLAIENNASGIIGLQENGENPPVLNCRMFDVDGGEITYAGAVAQGMVRSFESRDPAVVTVDSNGALTAVSTGKTTVSVTITIGEVTRSAETAVTVTGGKSRSSYYRPDRVETARENARLYSWAASMKNSAVNAANKYLKLEDLLWNSVTTQELPRSYYVGYRADPECGYCRYCGGNIAAAGGSLYAWDRDALRTPWKISCPLCRREFPSNDFEEFYKLGIDEHGNWSYEQAKAENQKLVDAGKDGYLKNVLYPEKDEKLGVTGWGVDDGYGYVTGRTYANGVAEVHTYISFYNHWAVWHEGLLVSATRALRNAYLYTGEAQYGRVGAILIDRIADVYPDMDTAPYRWQLTADASYAPKGKVVDLVWENQYAREWSWAYDAFFPMFDDPDVISFLSQKAADYSLENTKETPAQIRANCEDGILREIFRCAQNGQLNGNFGMTESAVALAGVVLDTMPETRQMIDWVFQDGVSTGSPQADRVTGGNVLRQLVDNVDRDGISDEVSPNYSDIWVGGMTILVDALAGYDGYPEMDLYNNPRFVKMIAGLYPLTLSRRATAQIGDSGAVADATRYLSGSRAMAAFQYTGLPQFAQILYFGNGNRTTGLHYDIFTKNPESLARDVQAVIDQYGEYDFDSSRMLAGYGFAALRGGHPAQGTLVDTQRTFWMSFARGAGHGHRDGLNLGIEAFGLNLAPELGYPHKVIGDLYANWGKATVAHNTVVVNRASQTRPSATSKPLHFDSTDQVQLMDVSAPERYSATEEYRRTVVTVDVGENLTYGVDFFRVKGGTDHRYSFHALTAQRPELGTPQGQALALTPQTNAAGQYIGSYAGADVPFQTEGISSGFSYLKDVDRRANPGKELYADFTIQDFRGVLPAGRNPHLRLTMLNDFALSELAVAMGKPAEASGNPEELTYLIAQRSGANLDSLFTTVLEPYDGARFISSLEQAPVVRADGKQIAAGEAVKAVKVSLANGRCDYIVYAADNTVEYRVDDLFSFQGFVGVYSIKDGENVYSYLNDGAKLGELSAKEAYTGTVTDFTKGLVAENEISVFMAEPVDPQTLKGKFIYIDHDGVGNAAYEILDASSSDGRNIRLDIGDVTLVRSTATAVAGNYTFRYNIAEGQSFRIPLSATSGGEPRFETVEKQQIKPGETLRLTVSAESPLGKPLRYNKESLPEGAQFQAATRVFTWTPTEEQVGEHTVKISATDGERAATLQFDVSVIKEDETGGGETGGGETGGGETGGGETGGGETGGGETGGGETGGGETGGGETGGGETGGGGTGGGGTGGGGTGGGGTGGGGTGGGGTGGGGTGGGGTGGGGTGGGETDTEQTVQPPKEEEIPSESTDDPTDRFRDLNGFDWAEDAIYELAAKGIILGTGTDTFAPGANITRADFTILLVRAFGLTGDGETDTFTDVSADAYYARELAIAKSTGLVNGMADGSFNPTGEISREDMMVIATRALWAAGKKLAGSAADLVQFADAGLVSGYAADSVGILVNNQIITGANGRINPKAKATRAETAVMLQRILEVAFE